MRRHKLKTEIAIATLECARADLDYEIDRTRSLDSKLTGIASLSGLALSIGAGVGASIVAGGKLSLGTPAAARRKRDAKLSTAPSAIVKLCGD